ncbi:methyl-accepting chemotaxis protein [Comamonas sp. NLF-1-9]|uniref:methyl-accepting chemotaxis protein n=1 Tax=Comamonas sp. NLF-1-9 TaxID=2853163 RepID=UPI001C43AFFB|nr:methyl-accepting chemotaxis protein [Comamonas sp. NLF-1-9]QXL83696.1 MCP four helix bundle domain-containing protein [Comamonas sp. NLF-1-9]
MKITTRLALGFALMALLLVVTGLVALWKATPVEQSFKAVTEERIPRVLALHEVQQQINLIALAMRDVLLESDIEAFQNAKNQVPASRQRIAEILGELKQQMRAPRAQELLGAVFAQQARYVQAQEQFFEEYTKAGAGAAQGFLSEQAKAVRSDYLKAIADLQAFQRQVLEGDSRAAGENVRAIQTAVAITLLIGLLAAVLLALWIIRAITRPLNQAVRVAQAVAAGDLSQQIEARGNNETAQLLRALAQMLEGLHQVVARVRGNSENVATASAEISQATLDLSARTEEQASALEQTAASMEQLNATVRQNADNARQANQLAHSASSVAREGGDVVGNVVQTMRGISGDSQKMAEIITVIDSIAFQTNILALNAAVEAARAGEQGRGFAVVASEVRQLAGRSAAAAKEIKQLIDDSTRRIGEGTTLADKAGATMEQVVAGIQRVSDLMGEISAASQEQSQGVTQVGEAITQMDQVTQQNAALVEEMSAAAASLQSQAQEMVGSVATFKLQPGSAPAPAVRVQRPATAAPVQAPVQVPIPAPAPSARPLAAPAPAVRPKALPDKGSDAEWESF